MSRPFFLALADAFTTAAHAVYVAPEVHDAYGRPAPTGLENLAYWCHGFAAGLFGVREPMPLVARLSNEGKPLSRPLSLVLADAFDTAAHDVCTAPEVHAHYGDLPPTARESLAYWCRGFVTGLVGNSEAVPLAGRIKHWVGKVFGQLRRKVFSQAESR